MSEEVLSARNWGKERNASQANAHRRDTVAQKIYSRILVDFWKLQKVEYILFI